jgi:hypothetical protein
MARLHAVALGMPPLLADMIRDVLRSRGDIEIVAEIGAEIAASPRLIERLQALDPDLVMIGETSAENLLCNATVTALLKRPRVITLSRDGRFILDAGEKRELTAGVLIELLSEIGRTI